MKKERKKRKAVNDIKQMTKLENIIMNRSGCNRETANLIANGILQEVEKDLKAELAREIFAEIEEMLISSSLLLDCTMLIDTEMLAELKKKYTEYKV